jgi:penicillin-binding protein 1C
VALDRTIQATAQRCAKAAIQRHHGKIGNAAVIIMDVPSTATLAYVGSADFYETPGGGQVDACRAPRSPGSALKPFTYALAMERNCLYACEQLLDRTLDYGLYSPENIDGSFCGLIRASDALKHSLNVPAVTVLARVGVEEVYACLQRLGFTTLTKPSEHYGLGLTLGNCEVRLDELAAAYCSIATARDRDSHPFASHETGDCPCFSRGTCLKLFEMLEQPLPDGFGRERVSAKLGDPRVCWKTGTSTGQRDAWAVVFNTHYVVAVWMGNNDGSASSHLIGARSALPLAAEIFRLLPRETVPEWPVPGDDLHPVRICAVSGLPATPWCLNTKRELLPRAQFLHRRCDVHYPAHSDGSQQVAERWPGKARGWDLADIASPVPATLVEPDKAPRLEVLRILVPSGEAEYVLTGEAQGDRLRLQASVDQEGPLFWYLDDAYLGTSEPHRPLYLDLEAGTHRVACMSEDGMLDSLSFEVVRPAGSVEFVN